ncbi:MAG TPA: ABC transporter permease, partial [Steroidobacteraceae bacterium]|nr:ABC transporter permease [Steroidobacteraceae bacterium]
MFGYYLSLALRSLRQNALLTVLIVLAIGTGVGASMTMLTIFRAAGGDPIPEKSAHLFDVLIDNYGPAIGSAMPPLMTYTDAQALMQARRAARQAAMYPLSLSIIPSQPGGHPIHVTAHATYADFFPMFDVPFEYGTSWGSAGDDGHAAVAVITHALSERLFG